METTGNSNFQTKLAAILTWFSSAAIVIVSVAAILQICVYFTTGDWFLAGPDFGSGGIFTPFMESILIWGIPISIATTPDIIAKIIKDQKSTETAIVTMLFGFPIIGIIMAILAGIAFVFFLFPISIVAAIISISFGAFEINPIFGIVVFLILSGLALSALGFGESGEKVIAIIFFKDD